MGERLVRGDNTTLDLMSNRLLAVMQDMIPMAVVARWGRSLSNWGVCRNARPAPFCLFRQIFVVMQDLTLWFPGLNYQPLVVSATKVTEVNPKVNRPLGEISRVQRYSPRPSSSISKS